MIDQNRDGFIDSEDLKDMLASLGKGLAGTAHTILLEHCLISALSVSALQGKSLVMQWWMV